jgi:predicted dehydrogenase
VLDLHIHDTDYVQYLFGIPQAVDSFGAKHADFGWSHIVTRYMYDDDKLVTAEGSWQMMPSFGFEMSFNIAMEEATIVYDSTRDPGFRIYPANGEPFTSQVEEGDGYSLEIAHFVRTISDAEVESVTTLEESRNSVMIVQAETESLRTGGRICLP